MFFRKPYNVILVVLFVALVLLTLLPLLSIVLDTVTVHSSEVRRIHGTHAGDFTDYHWRKILMDGSNSVNIFYKPLWNTILISLATCAISIGLGGSMAWLITRSDIKYKSFLSALFVVPYIMPSWTLALAVAGFFPESLCRRCSGHLYIPYGHCDAQLVRLWFLSHIRGPGTSLCSFCLYPDWRHIKEYGCKSGRSGPAAPCIPYADTEANHPAHGKASHPVHISSGLFQLHECLCRACIPGSPRAVPGPHDSVVPYAPGIESWLRICDGPGAYSYRRGNYAGESESTGRS